jgi:histidyl-tRNA synthetase
VPLAAVRGMHDSLGAACAQREQLRAMFASCARAAGFERAETPAVEDARLYARGLGAASDVVCKEMYLLDGADGGADGGAGSPRLALRPEGTAGVLRALLGAGALRARGARGAAQPVQRLFYDGDMFRRERPQRGRFRAFAQLGVELLGGAGDAAADVEALALAAAFLARAAPALRVTALVNTLGDAPSRRAWAAALDAHFRALPAGALSAASAARLARGAALRILDSKDAADAAAVAAAPPVDAFLTPAARDRFADVLDGLRATGVPHRRAPALVRGLDYYRHTIFEFVVDGAAPPAPPGGEPAPALWAPAPAPAPAPAAAAAPANLGSHLCTVLAGGRYDGLAALIAGGGDDVPAVGWAAGLERLCLLAPPPPPPPPFTAAVLPVWRAAAAAPAVRRAAARAAQALRGAGVRTLLFDRAADVGKAVGAAAKAGADAAVILGEDELAAGTATVKDLRAARQTRASSLDGVLAAVLAAAARNSAQVAQQP